MTNIDYTVHKDYIRPTLPCVMIDFDGVASRDPTMFLEIAEKFFSIGLDYLVCTSRTASDVTNDEIFEAFNPSKVVFCEGETKKRVAEELGINVAFWIDDTPEDIIDQIDIQKRFNC